MAEKKKSELGYFKFYYDTFDLISEELTDSELGAVIRATMSNVKNSENELHTFDSVQCTFAYKILMKQLNASREAYLKKCETNRENGSLGGNAKAKNYKNTESETKQPKPFKPTKKQFFDTANYIYNEFFDGERYDPHLLEMELEKYQNNGWIAKPVWGNRQAQITNLTQMEAVIYAYAYADIFSDPVANNLIFSIAELYPERYDKIVSLDFLYALLEDFYNHSERRFTITENETERKVKDADEFLEWFYNQSDLVERYASER